MDGDNVEQKIMERLGRFDIIKPIEMHISICDSDDNMDHSGEGKKCDIDCKEFLPNDTEDSTRESKQNNSCRKEQSNETNQFPLVSIGNITHEGSYQKEINDVTDKESNQNDIECQIEFSNNLAEEMLPPKENENNGNLPQGLLHSESLSKENKEIKEKTSNKRKSVDENNSPNNKKTRQNETHFPQNHALTTYHDEINTNNILSPEHESNENPTNKSQEFIYVNKVLHRVSESLLCIVKAYSLHSSLQKIGRAQDIKRSMTSYLTLKYKLFKSCYVTVKTIILPNVNNLNFVREFLRGTEKLGIDEGMPCNINSIELVFNELLKWSREKKDGLTQPTVEEMLEKHRVSEVTFKNNYPMLKKQLENSCNHPINKATNNLNALREKVTTDSTILDQFNQPKEVSTACSNDNIVTTQSVVPSVNDGPFTASTNTTTNISANMPSNDANLASSLSNHQSKLLFASGPPGNLIKITVDETILKQQELQRKQQRPNPNIQQQQVSQSFTNETISKQQEMQRIQSTVRQLSSFKCQHRNPNSQSTQQSNNQCQQHHAQSFQNMFQQFLPRQQTMPQTSYSFHGSTLLHHNHTQPSSNFCTQPRNIHPQQTTPSYWQQQPQNIANFPQSGNVHQQHNIVSSYWPQQPQNIANCSLQYQRTQPNPPSYPPPPYRSVVIETNDQTPPEMVRSSSKDSGFMSPLNFNSPTMGQDHDDIQIIEESGPQITNVTSCAKTFPQVDGVCYTCGKLTKTMCKGCYQRYYCSESCQQIDWFRHKEDCKRSWS